MKCEYCNKEHESNINCGISALKDNINVLKSHNKAMYNANTSLSLENEELKNNRHIVNMNVEKETMLKGIIKYIVEQI